MLRMMKYENEFMLAALIMSFLICCQYLLQDYNAPSTDFVGGIFYYVTPSFGSANLILMFLTVSNFLIGLMIGVYLFTRKIPLRKKLLTLKYN